MKNNDKNTEVSQSCKKAVSGSTLISDCDLSIRTKKLFENIGLLTVKEILDHKQSDLMKYRGFGERSLNDLRSFLILNNLSFSKR
jgi:DNA-directed RNA polymerase alpha subunit